MKMRYLFLLVLILFAVAVNAQPVKSIKVTELEKTIKESKTPLIVNFWATYCVPCIQEIPDFLKAAETYKSKNLTLVFVSLDLRDAYPNKIDSIGKKLHLPEPLVWLNETNADYFCPRVDTSWSGGIPSSLFINNATGYRKFFEDQLSKEKLEKEVKAMIREN
jgi:thiol-disulfide isomerase/thioredoxin